MPIIDLPDVNLKYYLVVCDETGNEKDDIDGIEGKLTARISNDLQVNQSVTDVYLICHGWLSDLPGAERQYGEWIRCFHSHSISQRGKNSKGSEYTPVVIGLHWPSRPVGIELLASGAPGEPWPLDKASIIDFRKSLSEKSLSILDELLSEVSDNTLVDLDAIGGLYARGSSRTPNTRECTERSEEVVLLNIRDWLAQTIEDIPERFRRKGRTAVELAHELLVAVIKSSPGGHLSSLELLVRVAHLTSFFRMKDRAHIIGSKLGCDLLETLNTCKPQAPGRLRVHLIGHSFGGIVLSAALTEGYRRNQRTRVQSLSILQGALSIWSFSKEIPGMLNECGVYGEVGSMELVDGPIVITQSRLDTALSWSYEHVTRILDARRYETGSVYPDYAAMGADGARGYGIRSVDLRMQPADQIYGFEPMMIYNLQADAFICDGTDFGQGAHNDIAKPEVANAVWQAASTEGSKMRIIGNT